MEYLPWKVIENNYEPERNLYYETNFTLANGYMGLRGCLEEGFNNQLGSYPGNYIAGVFDHFDGDYVELVNCPDFIGVHIWIGSCKLNMTQGILKNYRRTLDMREGTLTREFVWEDPQGNNTHFYFQRFLSMHNVHLSCIRVRITPLDHMLPIMAETGLDGDIFNRRQRDYPPIKTIIPNYHLDVVNTEKFSETKASLETITKTTGVSLVQYLQLEPVGKHKVRTELEKNSVRQTITFDDEMGKEVGFDKYVLTHSSRDKDFDMHEALVVKEMTEVLEGGYDRLCLEHKAAWERFWDLADIRISGDDASQQGIRFNIFNLIQANAYWDSSVNLPAKLLSHTRYKGNAFWDTEMFMFPFYLFTNPEAARNLLMYRYHMLPAARRNAQKHHLKGAMYPWMSADDGSEQCDSWEYGECEIHITADIAYVIDQYVQTTGDKGFLANQGAEILIETARFWVGRVAWDERRGKYTILTVKGPDEYCSIANNNMYTNYMAQRNLELAIEAVEYLQNECPKKFEELKCRLDFEYAELDSWKEIGNNIYHNWDEERNLLIQDDAFMDYPEIDMERYADRKLPLLEIIGYESVMRHRILRQADVLLLMYLLNNRFTKEQKQIAYDFYEPLTTHDSSLSYNTHCIMAAELGMKEKAVDYFMKSCRLDLDDEQDTACSGLHGASLGGTWQAIVNGFGGVRVIDYELHLKPMLPPGWKELAFKLSFRGRVIEFVITEKGTKAALLKGNGLCIYIDDKKIRI